MKKTLAVAAIAALAGVAGAANAADMYSPAGGLKDTPYVAAPTWTGFYIGANVGGVWANMQTTDVDGWYAPQGSQWGNQATGVIGGGQVGYNYQTGAFVFGVEADFGGTGLSKDQHFDPAFYTRNEGGFYADVTGRLGYAMGPALFYAKGGWAYTDGGVSVYDTNNYSSQGGSATGYSVCKKGLDGWTIGGGIEYKINPTWGVKGEYRYFDFGTVTGNILPADVGTARFDRQLTANAVTVGVNYYVGSIYSPLK